jgi:hypothetical protein
MQHASFEIRQRIRSCIIRALTGRARQNKPPLTLTDLMDIVRSLTYGNANKATIDELAVQRGEVRTVLYCMAAEGEVNEETNSRGWAHYSLPTSA